MPDLIAEAVEFPITESGFFDLDLRELCCFLKQGMRKSGYSGCDNPAEILARGIDGVDGRCGPEIADYTGFTVFLDGGRRGYKPVDPDGRWRFVFDFETEVECVIDENRCDSKMGLRKIG